MSQTTVRDACRVAVRHSEAYLAKLRKMQLESTQHVKCVLQQLVNGVKGEASKLHVFHAIHCGRHMMKPGSTNTQHTSSSRRHY